MWSTYIEIVMSFSGFQLNLDVTFQFYFFSIIIRVFLNFILFLQCHYCIFVQEFYPPF